MNKDLTDKDLITQIREFRANRIKVLNDLNGKSLYDITLMAGVINYIINDVSSTFELIEELAERALGEVPVEEPVVEKAVAQTAKSAKTKARTKK